MTLLINLTAGIVAAYVRNNAVPIGEVADVIRQTYGDLKALSDGQPASSQTRRSILRGETPDVLTCLECGMRMKMLKRHLLTVHNLTPDEYRQKQGLAADAPMVTSNYAELRSKLAKASGLGKRTTGAFRRGRR